jgi:hypothetical protein
VSVVADTSRCSCWAVRRFAGGYLAAISISLPWWISAGGFALMALVIKLFVHETLEPEQRVTILLPMIDFQRENLVQSCSLRVTVRPHSLLCANVRAGSFQVVAELQPALIRIAAVPWTKAPYACIVSDQCG